MAAKGKSTMIGMSNMVVFRGIRHKLRSFDKTTMAQGTFWTNVPVVFAEFTIFQTVRFGDKPVDNSQLRLCSSNILLNLQNQIMAFTG